MSYRKTQHPRRQVHFLSYCLAGLRPWCLEASEPPAPRGAGLTQWASRFALKPHFGGYFRPLRGSGEVQSWSFSKLSVSEETKILRYVS